MVYVNPSLSNDLLNTLQKNKVGDDNGGYRGYYEDGNNGRGGAGYDYGDDNKSVLYVKG